MKADEIREMSVRRAANRSVAYLAVLINSKQCRLIWKKIEFNVPAASTLQILCQASDSMCQFISRLFQKIERD